MKDKHESKSADNINETDEDNGSNELDDDSSYYYCITDIQFLYDIPIFWLQNKKSTEKLYEYVSDIAKVEIESDQLDEIINDVTNTFYENNKFQVIENIQDSNVSDVGKLNIDEEELDKLVLEFLKEEKARYEKESLYENHQSGFLSNVRQADGEYVPNNRGFAIVLIVIFIGIVLLTKIFG